MITICKKLKLLLQYFTDKHAIINMHVGIKIYSLIHVAEPDFLSTLASGSMPCSKTKSMTSLLSYEECLIKLLLENLFVEKKPGKTFNQN